MAGRIKKPKNMRGVPFEYSIRLSFLIKPKNINEILKCRFFRVIIAYSYAIFEKYPSVNKNVIPAVLVSYLLGILLLLKKISVVLISTINL